MRTQRRRVVLGLACALMATALLFGCDEAATPPSGGGSAASGQAAVASGSADAQTSAGGQSASGTPGAAAASTPPKAKAGTKAKPAVKAKPQPHAATTGAQPYDASQLDPRVTQATIARTIGVSGWSSRVRPPESVTEKIKRALMKQHHYTGRLSDYELDHFIPIGVGGASTLSNLWLEPIAEAHRKDGDELMAHDYVVEGRWTLAQGQQYIRDRWRIHYAQ